MIDHTGVRISDVTASKKFYATALVPIGFALLKKFPAALTGGDDVAGFGEPPQPEFWLHGAGPNYPRVHVAFRASSQTMVDAFYAAAIKAGGRDNGAPGARAHYHVRYYAAFVLDPDGHSIEVVFHSC